MTNDIRSFDGKTFILRYGQLTVKDSTTTQTIGTLPIEAAKGKTFREILDAIEANRIAWDQVNTRVTAIRSQFPTVSFGYIGNIESCYDDTVYYFFYPNKVGVGTFKDRIGGYRSWDAAKLLDNLDAIEEAIERRMTGQEVAA